jgi:hypothetical protein
MFKIPHRIRFAGLLVAGVTLAMGSMAFRRRRTPTSGAGTTRSCP